MRKAVSAAPRFEVAAIDLFERDVRLRMPFRFGVVTLTEAPQAFARATINLPDGRQAQGAAAELLAPKWFDKNPALSNEDNFEQLRTSLRLARDAYVGGGQASAFGHFEMHHAAHVGRCAGADLNALIAGYGPALIDRAVLDALCRALKLSFYQAICGNAAGIVPSPLYADLAGFDLAGCLAGLQPAGTIAARHTVGLVDPITRPDQRTRVNDGLPETLEEVIARYGHRWFKLKVAGDLRADIERLTAIAGVLDSVGAPYRASLDGNEQYDDVAGVLELMHGIAAEPRLARLAASVIFIEQPIKRQNALTRDISALAAQKPVIIDESDDSFDAFPRACDLGYVGVSSKTCKGFYKSLVNRARCEMRNRAERVARSAAGLDSGAGDGRYFMSAEDLTIQAGLALQQDLALVALLGITHVERNGHHYVNGMADLPVVEQQRFLAAHPDLYEHSHGATRVAIRDGELSIGSLEAVGFASGAMPDWPSMRPMPAATMAK